MDDISKALSALVDQRIEVALAALREELARGSNAGAAAVRPDFLGTRDAAVYLGLARKTLTNYRSMGLGPAFFKQGKLVKYRLTDLGVWQAAQMDRANTLRRT